MIRRESLYLVVGGLSLALYGLAQIVVELHNSQRFHDIIRRAFVPEE